MLQSYPTRILITGSDAGGYREVCVCVMQEIQGGWAGAWGGVGDGERNYTTSIISSTVSQSSSPLHTHTHTHTPSLLIISLSPTSSHLSLFFSHLICSLSLFLHRIFLHLIPFSSSPSICYFSSTVIHFHPCFIDLLFCCLFCCIPDWIGGYRLTCLSEIFL